MYYTIDWPIISMMKISFSDLSSYKLCPKKYRFTQDKAPFDSSLDLKLRFGSALHNALKMAYENAILPPSKEQVIDFFTTQWQISDDDKEKAYFLKGVEVLNYFLQKYPPSKTQVAALEKPITLNIGGHTITGRFDRVDQIEDGVFEVIDYKTGDLRDAESLKYDWQLAIYHLAVKNMYQAEEIKCSLIFLLHNSHKISHDFAPEEIADLQFKIIETISAIENDQEFKPNPGKHCGSCGFAPICPATRHRFMRKDGDKQELNVEGEKKNAQELIDRFLKVRHELKKLKLEEEEIKVLLTLFMEQENLITLEGDSGKIIKQTSKTKEFDLDMVAKTLSPEQFQAIVKISSQKLNNLFDELDKSAQEKIEQATTFRENTALRIKLNLDT